MLYLHLPFCKAKCAYCAFCSGTFPLQTQQDYIKRLIALMHHYCKDKTFETVYIGGGTPSALSLPLWKQLLAALGALTDVSMLREFTVELNPESTTKELLLTLKNGGVDRLSFGVQSLIDEELVAIGRLHTAAKALQSIRLAADCGFENIGADLIYGLPGQTPESFEKSLSALLTLPVDHLSCYNLQLEEGTPLYQKQAQLRFADEEEQLVMYERLLSLTKAAGFVHYEISNFAHPGKQAVHNSGYWTGKDYLGLGAAAHSKLENCRYSFLEDVEHFITKEDFSFDECLALSEQDKREEVIMLGLRTDQGVKMSFVDRQKVQKYVSYGLGEIKGDRFVLNEQGFMVSNTIIADLI